MCPRAMGEQQIEKGIKKISFHNLQKRKNIKRKTRELIHPPVRDISLLNEKSLQTFLV